MYRLFLLTIICLSSFPASAQDAEKFAEGKVAMSHNDCATARHLFESESSEARKTDFWLNAVAEAAECMNDLQAALAYYEEESRVVISDKVTTKIAELRYELQKQSELAQLTAKIRDLNNAQGRRRNDASARASSAVLSLKSFLQQLPPLTKGNKVFRYEKIESDSACLLSFDGDETERVVNTKGKEIENRTSYYESAVIDFSKGDPSSVILAADSGVNVNGAWELFNYGDAGSKTSVVDFRGVPESQWSVFRGLLRDAYAACNLTRPIASYIPRFDATVGRLAFYENGSAHLEVDQRRYSNQFSQRKTRFVWWDLEIQPHSATNGSDFEFTAVTYGPSGLLNVNTTTGSAPEGGGTFLHNDGLGSDNPGTLSAGSYHVDVYVDGILVAKGAYDIVN